MIPWLADGAGGLRLGVFLGVLAALGACERWWPRRRLAYPRRVRWPSNLAIVALDAALLRILVPILAVDLALHAQQAGWGAFNQLPAPWWLSAALSVVLLDFAVYLQHRVFHAVPLLWRLHRMHHADLDVDATTGARFHPLEILLSAAIKLAVVAALGAPAMAVVVFEVLLNASSMFNHANLRIPEAIDRWLRRILVTPDMHRVHHSVVGRETNRNFGFNLPWWDHLLGTYQAEPAAGHAAMTVGIAQFRTAADLRLDRMLLQPFRGSVQPSRDH